MNPITKYDYAGIKLKDGSDPNKIKGKTKRSAKELVELIAYIDPSISISWTQRNRTKILLLNGEPFGRLALTDFPWIEYLLQAKQNDKDYHTTPRPTHYSGLQNSQRSSELELQVQSDRKTVQECENQEGLSTSVLSITTKRLRSTNVLPGSNERVRSQVRGIQTEAELRKAMHDFDQDLRLQEQTDQQLAADFAKLQRETIENLLKQREIETDCNLIAESLEFQQSAIERLKQGIRSLVRDVTKECKGKPIND